MMSSFTDSKPFTKFQSLIKHCTRQNFQLVKLKFWGAEDIMTEIKQVMKENVAGVSHHKFVLIYIMKTENISYK